MTPTLKKLCAWCGSAMAAGFVLILLSGCGEDFPGEGGAETEADAEVEAEAGTVTVQSFVPEGRTGELVVGDVDGEGARFRACEDEEWRTLVPADGGVAAELESLSRGLGSGGSPVVAHLVIEDTAPREPAGEGRIAQVRSVFPEGAGCPDVLPDSELQARGNEPFWGIDVEGDSARVRTPENLDGTVYRDGGWSRTPTGWRFDARAESVELALEIVEERCHDGMSGAWHPFTARAVVGEVEWTGCALEGTGAGTLSPTSAPGG